MAAKADAHAEDVQQAVSDCTAALDLWTACIAEKAAARADIPKDQAQTKRSTRPSSAKTKATASPSASR